MLVIKRLIDILFSLLTLLIVSPVLLIISLLIKKDSNGPIMFLQDRIGYRGEIFKIYKFRTMIDNAENLGSGLKTDNKDPRITKTGNFLRKTSLDEIPQLINVLKGEMSLIGPRPAPKVLLPRMTEEERIRLRMRPGLTGWAQINGRTELTWKEKFEKDVWYVQNYSLQLDVKIFWKTILYVLLSKGVYTSRYSEDVETMNKKFESRNK